MGHERLGTLPRTRPWRVLVEKIAAFDTPGIDVSDIAEQTLRNVNVQFRRAYEDEGVNAAFRFLVELSAAFVTPDSEQRLRKVGIRQLTPLSLTLALKRWISEEVESPEYAEIAVSAASDAIVGWYEKNKTSQAQLFEPTDESIDTWRKAGNGAGFCELARRFFAKFTERYLNYFLDRAASAALWDIDKRDRLTQELHDHIDEISQYAFETSKITQSFAAGWFNKNVKDGISEKAVIKGFLRRSFGKIRDELLRETGNNANVPS